MSRRRIRISGIGAAMAVVGIVVASAVIEAAPGEGDRPRAPTTQSAKPQASGEVVKPQAPGEAAKGQAATKPAKKWKPPQPTSGKQRVKERRLMVDWQIARSRYGSQAIKDSATLEAMRAVPRHVFVPKKLASRAYADTPLPIGMSQTISQPYIVALMTELLQLKPGAKVLEIGTGSGYQAAVLAQLTKNVYTVEIIKTLHKQAAEVLSQQGYRDVKTRNADGYFGWKEHGPYDTIIVTCASGHLPPPLWEQLKPGGRIVIPIGGRYEVQRLVVVTKTAKGKRRSRTVTAVRFVPMTGAAQGKR